MGPGTGDGRPYGYGFLDGWRRDAKSYQQLWAQPIVWTPWDSRLTVMAGLGGPPPSGVSVDTNAPDQTEHELTRSNPKTIKIYFRTLNLTADHPKSKMARESVFLFGFRFRL